jgi:transcriptional regulator with XRE-family HTH domain
MPRHLPSYLKPLRLQRGLSQPELAALLGIGPSLLSKLESLSRQPTVKVMLAAEIVFGLPARDIFPGAFHNIEAEVVERARTLRKELRRQSNPASRAKKVMLAQMIGKSGKPKTGL